MNPTEALYHPATGTALRQYADAGSLAADLNALVRDLCTAAEADMSVTPAVALCLADRISKVAVKVRKLERTLDEITADAQEDAQLRAVPPPGVVVLDQYRATRVRTIPIAQGPVG